MALLYLSLGIFLGGISALTIMAALFVAKEADDNQDEISADLTSVVTHQDITKMV